jgi:Nucleotidyl transferase AbiEii toxin, Type IV TA system
MHKETVIPELLEVLKKLMALEPLAQFRLVGGTAISLQMGHRMSIDIDLFSNEKVSKRAITDSIQTNFETATCRTTSYCINAIINDVKIDIYDEWSIPFLEPIVDEEGIRFAALEDLATFKLSAFTERRQKKDYVDLYFLFNKFGGINLLEKFRIHQPLCSPQSILFALKEVDTAASNKSVMPKMLVPFSWPQAQIYFKSIAIEYFKILKMQKGKKDKGYGY